MFLAALWLHLELIGHLMAPVTDLSLISCQLPDWSFVGPLVLVAPLIFHQLILPLNGLIMAID